METNKTSLKLSHIQLAHIAKQLGAGRPLWAVLQANEYLDRASPLRVALMLRAKEAMDDDPRYKALQRLISQALAGTRLGEFSAKAQKKLRGLQEESLASRISYSFVAPRSYVRSARVLLRQRV